MALGPIGGIAEASVRLVRAKERGRKRSTDERPAGWLDGSGRHAASSPYRTGSALTAARRAHRLADERCEGARTPALAAAEWPLTDREREIVTLSAQGLTNREIAERLIGSVRIVERHLYRAGHQLGVHERTELVGLLAVE